MTATANPIAPAVRAVLGMTAEAAITTSTAQLHAARARRIATLADAGAELIAGDPDSAHACYHRGYLVGLCRTLADDVDQLALLQVWTRCEDALPPMLPETVNDWRQESDDVLARNAAGRVVIARYCTVESEAWAGFQWILQGRDGMEADGIIAWKVIA